MGRRATDFSMRREDRVEVEGSGLTPVMTDRDDRVFEEPATDCAMGTESLTGGSVGGFLP